MNFSHDLKVQWNMKCKEHIWNAAKNTRIEIGRIELSEKDSNCSDYDSDWPYEATEKGAGDLRKLVI